MLTLTCHRSKRNTADEQKTDSKMMHSTRILISCPDKAGIVHAVSGFVAENGGNIIDSQQYSLGLNAQFFMRLVVDGLNQELSKLEELLKPISTKYKMDVRLSRGAKRMAVMVSRYDHCLYDVLLKQQYHEFNTVIPVIISNHADLKHVAEKFGIDFVHCPIIEANNDKEKLANKLKQENNIEACLKKYSIDMIVMARYMQILSANFVQAHPSQIINVHHSFLPAFKGANPYHQAYSKGVKIIGATAHYATEDLDMGPIITQGVIEVGHRDTVDDYIAKGRDIEKWVFSKAIKAHAEDKVIIHEGRTIVFD